ncbi:Bug family tripartite tricarboxylate transporter substrate binding protein [Ramlibacter sp.]|uniref:Bug family tripartite tricarboxylate transporter substrate binding protein n=1 Tax=Ramlibacter sp. TaxID=1917967 RepID=UPI003D11218C
MQTLFSNRFLRNVVRGISTLFSGLTTAVAVCAAMVLAAVSTSAAAAFPDRPITIIVPYPVGGATDLLAREVGRRMAVTLKQSVVIENRSGGTQMVAMAAALRAPRDGHTVVLGAVADAAIFAAGSKTPPPHDFQEDFAPVANLATSPHIMVVPASLPVRNVAEMVALIKKEPGKHNYASVGIGSMSHLEGELFEQLAGVRTTHLPYRGGAQALVDLIAGNSSLMFLSAPNAMPHVRSGKLRIRAVVAPRRISLLPDVPTFAEAGYQGFTANNRFGFFVAKGTPADVIDTLSRSVQVALEDKELRTKLDGQGVDGEYADPATFGRLVRTDFEYLGGIAKRSKITID